MTVKEAEVLKAVTNCLVRVVQNAFPGYPEEQMFVADKLSVSDVRKLIDEVMGPVCTRCGESHEGVCSPEDEYAFAVANGTLISSVFDKKE